MSPSIETSSPGEDVTEVVSYLAALEAAVDVPGHSAVLPYVGMARTEVATAGDYSPSPLRAVAITDIVSGLEATRAALQRLQERSRTLHQTLRLQAALELVDLALEAAR